jgi:hypothetical protein
MNIYAKIKKPWGEQGFVVVKHLAILVRERPGINVYFPNQHHNTSPTDFILGERGYM